MRSLRDSVFAERVRQHRGVLVLLQSHSETMLRSGGEEKMYIKLSTTVYILCASCMLHATRSEASGAGVRRSELSSETRRSELVSRKGSSIDSSIAGIDTLHPLGTFKC